MDSCQIQEDGVVKWCEKGTCRFQGVNKDKDAAFLAYNHITLWVSANAPIVQPLEITEINNLNQKVHLRRVDWY